ncbi:serine O-acetyltransferase [Pseudomonas sp. NFACC15-1]|uniref:serine O-acetyltransferase n=1 Tax=unclassified Pseudomonas TaxID=196821 RepID=UPI000883F2E7|nr:MULTISPECIES: serine O-acetyltransferase [unclassified Pseudomonas]SDA43095.1 serine O-acetyltransferase [Pseudomonas sp. NFACC15-1]SDW46529.1 serine O-acetyltransferase [Pseudomonas sp. NFACC14]
MEHDNPGLWRLLRADIERQRALFNAPVSRSRIKLAMAMISPRFAPVLLYRLAYSMNSIGLKIPARFFSLLNYVVFGIEIAAVCKIGPGLFFPHTQGTVIGAVSIGANAVIYQGVTLGAKDLDFTYDADHRPVIGNDVVIGAGAKVLGGITLDDNVTVAANSVLLTSMPANVIAAGMPAKIVKQRARSCE